MSAKKIVFYCCTACLYIVQFPFTLAGNFAVTLPIVTCLSTVKMYLCVLINDLVAVFLTVAQSVCKLCNFPLSFAGTFAVTCRLFRVCLLHNSFSRVLATVFAVLLCGCRGQGELLRYSPFFRQHSE